MAILKVVGVSTELLLIFPLRTSNYFNYLNMILGLGFLHGASMVGGAERGNWPVIVIKQIGICASGLVSVLTTPIFLRGFT